MRIAILTSGGDSQGMNAAVRAAVRTALWRNIEPYGVRNGYQGLVDNQIAPLAWSDVSGLLGRGGTVLGTARSKDFRTTEGRRKAALNLIRNGIDSLVVIGGDGSLTGADTLRGSWSTLLDELLAAGQISAQERNANSNLKIVGLVGSIDNDMSMTDMTIGCASALHRICEAVDAISATALSHGRAFVVEVMGRHCGWLATMAAIATGADFLLVPEHPPTAPAPSSPNEPQRHWTDYMCDHLNRLRQRGQQKIIVIVSEGAIDRDLKPIKSDYVREVLDKRLGLDARVTTLGHVQRGGSACFYDRYLATMQGASAVDAICQQSSTVANAMSAQSPMIGMSNNLISVVPLVEAVARTHEVTAAIERKDFCRAMELRDPEFAPAYAAFVAMSGMPEEVVGGRLSLQHGHLDSPGPISAAVEKAGPNAALRIAIMHVGPPAAGVNAATRAATLLALKRGHTVLAVNEGFAGLMRGDLHELQREDVLEWCALGGSALGTSRVQPSNMNAVVEQLEANKISALLIVGGFEGYQALCTMDTARPDYPYLNHMPIVLVPATISNNVPGTDFSLGCDTALNIIVNACDTLKQSASASRHRVFVMELQGGNVGYLPVMAALAGGAAVVYTPEEGISLQRISTDIQALCARYTRERAAGGAARGRILLLSETASRTYKAEVITSMINDAGRGVFDARMLRLGHLQQGSTPTPLDRTRAARLAALSVEWLESNHVHKYLDGTKSSASTDALSTVIGIRGADIVFTPVAELKKETDFDLRRAKTAWWAPLKNQVQQLTVPPYCDPSLNTTL